MQFSIGLAYDLLLALLVLGVALVGMRRGFLSGLVGLVGLVAGILAAVWANSNIAPVLYGQYIGPAAADRVIATLADKGDDVAALMQSLEFLPEALRTAIQNAVQNVSGDLAPQIIAALQPVLLPLIQAVLFFLVCFLVRLVFQILARLLRGFNALPLIGTVNKALGFAFGFVTGFVDCWLATLALWLVANITAGSLSWLNPAVLGQSGIYSFFQNYNPFLTH